ncbi:MAG TPA: aminotransferase class V-fold PLP-dependent enzyme [Methylomirabilota bacterium]|nr:aminotransferase class V-fold PLP-dependent enzyme [Methylomirabilota bacterium]
MWALDPGVAFLNHGSFGACPRPVLEAQQHLREELERSPVRFLARELEGRLAAARAALGAFVGADPDDLVFVPNATTAVNTVLRSLALRAGDELVTTDHTYNACRNALDFVADRADARVSVVRLPLPVPGEAHVIETVLAAVTPRCRLALLDHVTSPTGIVLPIERLVPALAERGVDTLVDGAHGPGMLDLDLRRLGAAYYAGNCHKWLCAPKGAAFLHVRRDRQASVRPLVLSHGANSPRTDLSRFRLEFDWTGTGDPTAYLTVPEAIRTIAETQPGGWPAVMARNRTLARQARGVLLEALGTPPPCPDTMLGALAAVPLPDCPRPHPPTRDALQISLMERFAIEVPVISWPASPKRLLRVSCHIYNRLEEYERLGQALRSLLSPAGPPRGAGSWS